MDKYQKRAAKAAKRAARAQRLDEATREVPIFWVEPTGEVFYRGTWRCANEHYVRQEIDYFGVPKEPIQCDQCELQAEGWAGGEFEIFVRPDTGETYRGWNALPIGAVYDAMSRKHGAHNWTSARKGQRIKTRPGIDGRVLVCMLPDGHPWTIDSRANNCTLPNDDKHWCWNRSGRPEDGTLDVRKGKPGQTTCSAGGGSIATSRYHGFLHNGVLRRC